MCPGGTVVAAASEPESVVTNGMSCYARDGANANSALLVGVGRRISAANIRWPACSSSAKSSTARSFSAAEAAKPPVKPSAICLRARKRSVASVRPELSAGRRSRRSVRASARADHRRHARALPLLGRRLRGLTARTRCFTGPETRSSPVRITRDETLQSVRRSRTVSLAARRELRGWHHLRRRERRKMRGGGAQRLLIGQRTPELAA